VKGVEILDGFVDDSPSLAKTCLPRVVAERDGPRLVARDAQADLELVRDNPQCVQVFLGCCFPVTTMGQKGGAGCSGQRQNTPDRVLIARSVTFTMS
jgi:hypothetical protein